jgi:hypothetical protein
MPKIFCLFDMDGVLLKPVGYHKSLATSVRRFAQALGAPSTTITEDQIARFEALNITNEWDSLAICVALTLVHLWHIDEKVRLNGIEPRAIPLTHEKPDFDAFLKTIPDGGQLPGVTTYNFLIDQHPWLSTDQRAHLGAILVNCRDIYQSLTLPAHQETVLGSLTFKSHYNLIPKLNTDSYLLTYDRPLLSKDNYRRFHKWLNHPDHLAGILTNRPSRTPPDFLSAPEAELGIELIGLKDLPYVGSGILGWFAETHCHLHDHSLMKPNPVHALTLLQRCLGRSLIDSLQSAVALWQGSGTLSDWQPLDDAKIIVFEDSAKGLFSGKEASNLIKQLGLKIDLTLVGVAQNPIKLAALNHVSNFNIDNINQIEWENVTSYDNSIYFSKINHQYIAESSNDRRK